jgi:hypothetical protein
VLSFETGAIGSPMDLGYLARSIFGQGVFLGFIFLAARMHSRKWREVAGQYARRDQASFTVNKWPETIIVTRRGAAGGIYTGIVDYQRYAGVRVSIRQDGIGLSLIPPLNVMSPPLFLPFSEMTVRTARWDLWSGLLAIRMPGLPEIDLVISRRLADWIQRQTPGSPFGM